MPGSYFIGTSLSNKTSLAPGSTRQSFLSDKGEPHLHLYGEGPIRALETRIDGNGRPVLDKQGFAYVDLEGPQKATEKESQIARPGSG
jgi:hypothetical protein